VDWDSVPVHGLCPWPNCEVPITVPPPGTAGGYTLIEHRRRTEEIVLITGAVFSTISSVAKLPRVVARTPLTSGQTCGTSCCISRPLASACVWRFMWTPLMRTRFARTVCPGSWIPSPSCSPAHAPAPSVLLYAPLSPALFSCLELLFLQARVCLLLGS
jgi:hypothetical protein